MDSRILRLLLQAFIRISFIPGEKIFGRLGEFMSIDKQKISSSLVDLHHARL
jgi:hypothetical protein